MDVKFLSLCMIRGARKFAENILLKKA